MKAHVVDDAGRRAELLRELMARQIPITLSSRGPDGWTALRSRVLAFDDRADRLTVEYPSDGEGRQVEIVAGQSVGIAFRRGHRKCVGNALVTGRSWQVLSPGTNVPVLQLAVPEELHELPRRLFYRAPVPEGVSIPVDFWRGDANHLRPRAQDIHRGTMADISAGGVGVLLPGGNAPRFDLDDPVVCSFTVERQAPPVSVCARFRYADDTHRGQLRIGFQFVGLDASPAGRATLDRIARLATRFQHLEMRHRTGR